jgi:hypothetical protein
VAAGKIAAGALACVLASAAGEASRAPAPVTVSGRHALVVRGSAPVHVGSGEGHLAFVVPGGARVAIAWSSDEKRVVFGAAVASRGAE